MTAALILPEPDSDRGRDLIARARPIRQAAGVGFDQMRRRLGICKSTLQRWETDPPQWRSTAGTPRLFVAILAALEADDEQA
jgi:hypothetical protein